MRKLDLYLKYAADCREIARIVLPSYQGKLKNMAEAWEELAEARRQELEDKNRKPNK